MVAGMVVHVRDRSVEADPAEQLPQIHRRLGAEAAELVGQQQIRPLGAISGAVLGLQQGEGADQAMAPVTAIAPVAIETLLQQHIRIAHPGEAALRHLQPAAHSQQQQAVLHARLVSGVGRRRELGQPKGLICFHGGFGAGGGSAFIAQATLYSAALGVATSQAGYATGENHERAVLRQLRGELDLEGVLIQADALLTQRPSFGSTRSREATSC